MLKAATVLDLDGWKEKLFRRSHSTATVDIYTRGVEHFGKFVAERMSLGS